MKNWKSSISSLVLVGGMLLAGHLACAYELINPMIGQTAPDFSLQTVHSSQGVSMNDARQGRDAILFFWATWCPHCRQQLSGLNAISDELQSQEISVIVVNLGEDREQVAAYLEAQQIGFDVFLDRESSLENPYTIIGIPTFVFIGEDGVVIDVTHSLPEDVGQVFD